MSNRVIGLIVAALVVWGAYHAVGAYLYNRNPWRAVMVVASMGAFLGLWYVMLRSRSARQRRGREDH